MFASRYAWCTPERFVELTMRQVVALNKVITKSETQKFYTSILSYRASRAKELPSLEEFLALALNEKPKEASGFDDKTEAILEAHALKTLEERRKQNGK